MNRRERVEACAAGKATDRPPASFWRHFFEEEVTGEGLARVMVGFQRQYDWDLVKINPRAHYHSGDWGVRTTRPGDAHSAPSVTSSSMSLPWGSPRFW